MRYCTRCGNPLEGERFCTKCGTNNGAVDPKKVRPGDMSYVVNNGAEKVKNIINIGTVSITISVVFQWVSIVMFFISMFVLAHHTIEMGTEMTSGFIVKNFGVIYIAIYFILGMWAIVPAVRFVLECGSAKKSSIIKAAFFMLILTLIFYISNIIISKIPDSVAIPDIILSIKRTGLIYLIYHNKLCIVSILTIVSGIIGTKLEAKEVR